MPIKSFIPAIVMFIVLAGAGLYVQKMIWDECRASGHSFLYCMALTSHK
jgi:hypothetical protein